MQLIRFNKWFIIENEPFMPGELVVAERGSHYPEFITVHKNAKQFSIPNNAPFSHVGEIKLFISTEKVYPEDTD